jgi:hypothetical protein
MHFTKGAWSIPRQLGIHLNTVMLMPHIGLEVVLILKEQAEFVEQIRSHGPFQLNLKAGAVNTRAGPILFMLWWFPPLTDGKPFAAYELLTSPESSPTGTQLIARASEQSHLHLVILDENEEVNDVVEFENNYELKHLVAAGAEISKNLVNYDFSRTAAAFFQEVSQEDLWMK